jgi:outer membrane protein assembly factor BamB
VLNDKIYAPNTDGFIYVMDMDGKPAGDPIEVGGTLWSAPATDGTLLYIASLDHKLHIIDPASGKITNSVDLGGAAPSSPVVLKDGAYVGSFASKIEFVSSQGHSEAITEASNWIWGTPALDNETLYYADLNGNIYSFDLATGKQNWGDVKPDGSVVARLLVVGDQIYVASEAGSLVALDRDAKIVWQKKVSEKGQIYTSPVVSGDLVLVAPYLGDFMLAAYDADGKQAWTFTPVK